MSDWRTCTIKDVVLGLYDGPHATPPISDEGPVFLGIGNVTEDGHLNLSDIRHIAEADFPKWTRRVTPQQGDIVFTYEATLNRYAIIPEGFRGCLGRRMALLRPDPRKADTRFLLYSFFGRAWRETIEANRLAGATVDRIPLTRFPDFPILLPPLETQRRIAGVLGAYDDLIEVNRRRIAVLEEMARGLFTEWFTRLRFPGHEDVAIEDTPYGPLPAGWHVRCVEDFGDVITGKTPSKAEPLFAGSDIPFVKIPDLQGTMFVHQTGEMLSEKGAASQANKTLPAGSVCVSCIGTIGLVGITTRSCQTNQQINTVIPRSAEVTEFLYFSFLRAKPDLVNLGSNGATMGNVNKRKFSDMKLVCPPQALMTEFHRRISPAIALVGILEVSNLRLAAARDLLLPRLISGQLSITRAEQELEAV